MAEVEMIRQYGTGWYHAFWSGELQVGDVMPLRYFGRDLVAWGPWLTRTALICSSLRK